MVVVMLISLSKFVVLPPSLHDFFHGCPDINITAHIKILLDEGLTTFFAQQCTHLCVAPFNCIVALPGNEAIASFPYYQMKRSAGIAETDPPSNS
jgi:hypothetical protein